MMAHAIQQRLVKFVKLDYDVRLVFLPTQHGLNIAGATVDPSFTRLRPVSPKLDDKARPPRVTPASVCGACSKNQSALTRSVRRLTEEFNAVPAVKRKSPRPTATKKPSPWRCSGATCL